MTEKEFNIWCVRKRKEDDNDVTESMHYAKKVLKEEGFNPQWITENECMKVKKKEKNGVYLFDPFEGQTFEHIQEVGCRIFGPQCIISSLQFKLEIPKRSTPVYNLAMKDLTVCCTSMDKTIRDELHKKVEMMGGVVSKDFTEHVTHLVAGEVGSKKYQVAGSLGKQIMSPKWIEMVWEKSQDGHIHGTDSQFHDYRCLVFMGLVITVSGLDSEERAQVKKLAESEGGKYTGEMKANECTHLIINKPKGSKYEYAKKWGVRIVKSDWLYDSIEKGFCLEENKYELKESTSDMDVTEVKTSTPEKHPAPDRGRSLADISCISNVSMMNVNETAAPTDMTRKSLGDVTRKSLNDVTRKSLGDITRKSVDEADETVNQIDLSKQTSDLFLDGCKIYLSGFRGSVLEKLRKVINAGGGTRLNQLNENVTHVIMGEKIDKDIQILKTASFRPHVVSSVWIAECYKQGKTVDEEPFYCFELPALDSGSPKLKSKKTEKRKTSEKEKEVVPDKQKVDIDNDEMEILSQYMLQPDQENRNNEDDDLTQDPDETYLPGVTQKTLNDEESVNQIDMSKQLSDLFLDGCKIYLSGFQGQVLEKLCKVINAGGGTRLNQLNENVTHVIMGEKIDKDIQILKTASFRPFVVNTAWIADCYKQGTTVDEKQFSCLELPAVESVSDNEKSRKMEDKKTSENETSPEKQKFEKMDGTSADVTVDDGRMFSKKVFMFFGFDEEPVNELTEYVTERGGLVIDEKDRRIPDYGIVPIDGYPVTRTVGEIATSAWLQMCLEQEKLLDISSNPLFTPIDITMETECLKDCVLCISGYSGTEHDCLMHIAETLGAICQVYFARTQSKGLLPNTHLILKEAGGSKYEAAKKWGIPALSKNWLLKCAKTGRRESESEYEIDRKEVSMETDDLNQDNYDVSIKTVEQNNLPNTSLNKSVKNLNSSHKDHEQREIIKDKSASNHDSTLNACEQMELSEFESSRNSRNLSKNEQEVNKNKLVTRLSDRKKDNSINIETSSVQNSDGRKPSLEETETKISKLQESQKENCIQQREDLTGKLQHSRLVEIRNELRSATPKNQSLHNASMSTPSPSKCLDVNQPFIPKFDISEAMQLLETPESQRKQRKLSRRKSSLSLEDYFTKHLEIGLKNIENYVPPSQEDGRVMEGDEDRPLDGVVIAVSKKLSSQQAEFNDIVAALGGDYIWTYDKSCTHFIFKGRANDTSKEFKLAKSDKKCIVSPYWIQMCKEQNARVDEALFPHHYNPNLNLSNVVSSKKSETPLRNSRRTARTPARTPAKPARVTSSKEPVETETNTEPAVTDKVTESDVTESYAHVSETKAAEEKITSTDQNEENKQEEQPQEVGQTIEMQEALSKHLENVMAMSKEKMDSQSSRAKKSRRKSKRLDSSGQFNESGETSGSGDRSSARTRRSEQDDLKESGSRRSTRSSVKGAESHHSGSEASQSVQVIWDDPTGRLERERLAHKLERACSPTQEVMSNYDEFLMENKPEFSDVEDEAVLNIPDPAVQSEEVKENKSIEERVTTPEAPSIAFPMPKQSTKLEQPELINLDEASREQTEKQPQKPPPVFIFSGLLPQEKDNYAALVEELGGKSSDAQYYDPTCTHLVIGSITRSEKFLASVAAGKWVLHKSYFEACRQENTFVQEDFYEWGGQGTMSLLSNQNPSVAKLAAAAHRWRLHIQEETLSQGSCSGAFNSWKVLLCAGENKEANFRRLLEAGGATVLNIKPPFPANLSCTHALLDLNKVKLTTEDLINLISAGILCLKPEFISAHLTEDPDKLDHRQYCPAEATELLSKMSDNSRERKRKTSSPLPAADTSTKRLRKK
ncbi:hypothetical protein KUTeg_015637 [Tegillarca granosa]|uniref:BRCT domain-containing protein n=1 Tax=Tegillarca granosa TaxID=220873 RepID=A0ABQ9EQQ3_TEGGR|nr:hypothetical protein KUTeg_015637 [Tegillarca granosa]